MWLFIKENNEWLFSGVGIILLGIFGFLVIIIMIKAKQFFTITESDLIKIQNAIEEIDNKNSDGKDSNIIKRKYYESLTPNRVTFLKQIQNIINNQFSNQEVLFKTSKDIFKWDTIKQEKYILDVLENDSEYIQRIFIDSPWGTGKSYFCKALEERINYENENVMVLKINAWKSDFFSDPLKNLVGEFSKHNVIGNSILEKAKELIKMLSNEILSSLMQFDYRKIKNIFFRENNYSMNEYQELLLDFKVALSKDNQKKIILIDELDRCNPRYAIELLEAIKHIFDVRNMIFIFFINKNQLKNFIPSNNTNNEALEDYFEKFFDVYFRLPEIDINSYLEIEFYKYNQKNTYNLFSENGMEHSNDNELIYEKLFFDILISGEKKYSSGKDKSIRNILKSFKKYKILISSLTSLERENYSLILCLTVYFFKEEFLWLDPTVTTNDVKIKNKINISKILDNLYSYYNPDFPLKKRFIKNLSYFFLNGPNIQNNIPSSLINLIDKYRGKQYCYVENFNFLESVLFKKIYTAIDDSDSKNSITVFPIKKEIFDDYNIENFLYKDQFMGEMLYSNELILDWCHNKYTFFKDMFLENRYCISFFNNNVKEKEWYFDIYDEALQKFKELQLDYCSKSKIDNNSYHLSLDDKRGRINPEMSTIEKGEILIL
ncbi:KAP family P-loop NTPase fold protein [Fusobacterium sp. PH5-44]|uniref:KAP family P-loop NTPase fold protein n=1 Tax=unclassified Fusobacterium TaxID=2648384 RepID=UPI003D230A59